MILLVSDSSWTRGGGWGVGGLVATPKQEAGLKFARAARRVAAYHRAISKLWRLINNETRHCAGGK